MLLRTSRRKPSRRVLVHGLIYFGDMFAELMNGDGWEFRYYPDTGTYNFAAMASALVKCDLAYQIGGRITIGRFLRAAKLLGKDKIVMHWVGSDVLDERRDFTEGRAESWVTQTLHHWAETEWMQTEVRSLGVPCELVPLPSSRVPDRPSPLPSVFSVLVYMPAVSRASLYGLDRILEAARGLPDVAFDLVGLKEGTIPDPPRNLRIHGRIPDLTEMYRQASVLWRPVRHDGLAFMVLEALGHGRHVLWTYAFPACVQVESAADACREIRRLQGLHKQKLLHINLAGVDAVNRLGYAPQHLKREIRGRLEQILES
jgi:hypothetical protein